MPYFQITFGHQPKEFALLDFAICGSPVFIAASRGGFLSHGEDDVAI